MRKLWMKSLHNQKLCVILQANANKSGIGSTSKVNFNQK